ncbi:hypothetical protein [Geobacter sp. DSM 9736]|uniref:hypothetical protein n=1 Tax=Geobacter sp. DSM 9736 TaxID=1277350 RepID=UPI000B507297|nr:hypothetical protein [Geobacter sp. DSM 9736]SNB45281.1 hypothetical protein SAMN06269301_0688 [Geobacter sp. DSM 9736]
MNRQKLILAILVVLLILSLVYSFWRMPRQQAADTKKGAPSVAPAQRRPIKPAAGAQSAAAAPQKRDDRKLHLDLLDSAPPAFAGFRRNIFQPIFREEAKVAPSPPPAPPVRRLPVPPPPPISPPPPAPPAAAEPTPVQREMARFTFLGFLKKDNRKTIFLSSNNEIFLVKKGDKIAGKYEVSNITDEALSISILPDGGEIVIPLVENKPLSAPRK